MATSKKKTVAEEVEQYEAEVLTRMLGDTLVTLTELLVTLSESTAQLLAIIERISTPPVDSSGR